MKSLADCRVLIVDDAKANLDILVEGLKNDHKLSLALDGESALQVAARTPPDLVLANERRHLVEPAHGPTIPLGDRPPQPTRQNAS